MFLGGRGAGKTRAGAEWVCENVRAKRFGRIALIAPTLHDAREVIVHGPAGIFACSGPRPTYHATRRQVMWPCGAIAQCFSAEDPESLRGPQFDAAWGDELAYWPDPARVLYTLEHAMRLGERPLMLLTTTPRPIGTIKALVADETVRKTTMTTWENAPHLAPGFLQRLRAQFKNTARERQELNAELIEDVEGALWRADQLDGMRIARVPPLEEIVVGVDPPAGMGAAADACGIVIAGAYGEGHGRRAVVLADVSVQGQPPHSWAAHIVAHARLRGAQAIVAEANNGGEMVRTVLRAAGPDMFVKLVRARLDKKRRAAPVAQLYEQGLVRHAGVFPALEDEMCRFGAGGFSGSPDRLDALVWALTELMIETGPAPQLRML